MDISSFVVTISDFFLMDWPENSNFSSTHRRYVIPKYQREYKWNEENVHTLITDINNRDKFLGNLILNNITDYYEIVDGQQRITTILLILLALFNKNKQPTGKELSEEQRNLLRYIFKDGAPVLENESLGKYLLQKDNEILLQIETANDIYYQKDTFKRLYKVIVNDLNQINDLMNFQKKVLDCQFLILIGNTHGRQNDSIEEVFLDINFKSQLLDVADIFKGYCFKNYPAIYHSELKEQWTAVRKYMKEFEKIGYINGNSSTETCPYLYHYLLSRPETYRIPVNLSYNGKHYLEGKSHTATKSLLVDMGNYGKHISGFIENLSKETYFFEDICFDAKNYQSDTVNHARLRQMFKDIILNQNVQYYKLPLFMVLHYLLTNPKLMSAFSYDELKKFLTNYYVYSFLFINSKRNKNKTAIDQTIFNALYQIDDGTDAQTVTTELLKAVKELRCKYLDEYKQSSNFVSEMAYALYSLMDHYSANSNYLQELYQAPSFSVEHLIAHDNRTLNVTWIEDVNTFTFSLNDLLGKINGKTNQAKLYRKLTANYLILPKDLNETLGNDDIVQKIAKIKEHYKQTRPGIPNHIKIFISHIESFDEFKNLSALKGQKASQEIIKDSYKHFVNTYFSDEKQRSLYEKLELALKKAFTN